jgi:hypothetical protein
MNLNFPDDIFEPHTSKKNIYEYSVKTGEQLCKDKSILFCGIARNVGVSLQRNILCLHQCGKLFQNYQIFIYENDSTDHTVEILKLNESEHFKYISEHREDSDYILDLNNGIDPYHSNRCKILAECRNKYLEYFKKSNYDYICVLDLDLKGGWSFDGFKKAFYTLNSDDSYGCVSAYGILADPTGDLLLENVQKENYIMYDSFVYRPKNWGVSLHILRTPFFNKNYFERGDEPVEVDSNFGGMAMYKRDAIINCSYGSKEWEEGHIDPDHVVLNRQMKKNNWKIVLDPSFIVSYSHHKFSRS